MPYSELIGMICGVFVLSADLINLMDDNIGGVQQRI
jgi:hypothetical protein